MRNVRVILWGLGAMGGGMGKVLLDRPGVEIVGAIDADPRKAGVDLGEALGAGKQTGVTVTANSADVMGRAEADIALLATASFVKEVYGPLEECMAAGLNVISIAEEMAYPWANNPELSARIDESARRRGVTVLGTGINPGFILDTLIISLTGVSTKVTRVRAARINDLSPFGPTVMRTQGVGTTPEGFRAGLEDGSIVGHVGFPESMMLIAKALGWRLDEVKQSREPIISKTHRETPHVRAAPGMVAGCRHVGRGFMDGKEVITLEHPQQIRPESEGVETGDYIWVEGEPSVNLSIRPEIPGGIGTIAIAVNMIPPVINAAPGLVTMADLPVPRAWMCDLRELIKKG